MYYYCIFPCFVSINELIQLLPCLFGPNQTEIFIKIFKAWHLLLLLLRESNYVLSTTGDCIIKNPVHQTKLRELFFFFFLLLLFYFSLPPLFAHRMIYRQKAKGQQFKVSKMFSVTFIMLDFWSHIYRGRCCHRYTATDWGIQGW